MNPLDSIFKPQSIAVVGASRRPGAIGRELMHNLIEYNFHGKVFPVNPKADYIHSIKAFPSVSAIPDAVDLAIIVVPRDEVLAVVDDCGKKGVKGLIVITAGFKETGAEGREYEEQLEERIARYGMRVIGPNCMGVINTHPEVRMDATFAPTLPLSGHIGFMSQSGGLGVAILNMARQLDIGFSHFVSMGNKLDVSVNDLLAYWEDDAQTELILMYLESFGNMQQFIQLARRASKRKPLVAVKSGRTTAGARAASSHTGAIASQGLDVATDDLLEQCGVIRVDTVEELFDVAMGFTKNPAPRGNRLAILTNAGGPAIMAADTAINMGLAIGKFSERTTAELKRLLPPEASIVNPVDMTPMSDRSKYQICARLILEDEGIDSLLVVFVPPIMTSAMEIASGIEELRRQYQKPVLSVMMAQEQFFKDFNEKYPGHMAIYMFPESAVRALWALDRHRQWRERPLGETKRFDVDRAGAEEMLAQIRSEGRRQLTTHEALHLLEAYGIPVARHELVRDMAEMSTRIQGFTFPAVLKAISPGLVHKTEAGGVALDLRTPEELNAAAARMMESLARHRREQGIGAADDASAFLVQEFVRGGREVILGMTRDPVFGPLLMFGLGGIFVETIKDVTFRVPPLSNVDAEDMIRQIRGYALLEGVRGEAPIDFHGLAEILQRFSRLVEDLPQISEIEVNPFLTFPERQQFRAVDARVHLVG